MDLDIQVAPGPSTSKLPTKAVDLPDPSVFDLQFYADNYEGELNLCHV